jgi:predicted ATPase
VLVLCEDVHWADPTTRELLDQVIDRVRCRSVLLIATFRPEFAPPWASDRHVSTLSLGRLDRGPAAALVGEVIGGETLSPELVASILERADGVPLFLEELTRAVLASTAAEAVPLVPATLQGSLLAQLNWLPEARNVAQVAVVIGREFPYDLLAATVGRPEEELRQALDQLVAAGICYGSIPSGHETYMFRHALLRDAAYESLLKSRRRELHARVAEVVADEPELLAHHLGKAGKIGLAIEYRCRAGERAVRRFANAEAIGHFREVLRLLPDLPDDPERDGIELLIQAAIGVPLMAAKGYSAPEIKQPVPEPESCAGPSALDPPCHPSCLVYAPTTWSGRS